MEYRELAKVFKVAGSAERLRIIDLLGNGGAMTVKGISDALHRNYAVTINTLYRMAAEGVVNKCLVDGVVAYSLNKRRLGVIDVLEMLNKQKER